MSYSTRNGVVKQHFRRSHAGAAVGTGHGQVVGARDGHGRVLLIAGESVGSGPGECSVAGTHQRDLQDIAVQRTALSYSTRSGVVEQHFRRSFVRATIARVGHRQGVRAGFRCRDVLIRAGESVRSGPAEGRSVRGTSAFKLHTQHRAGEGATAIHANVRRCGVHGHAHSVAC